MSNLTGKVALVTGASRGIGRAIAIELANHGAGVIINFNTNRVAADEVVEIITTAGGKASVFQADVSNEAMVKALFDHITKTHGGIDILVNNAGATRDNVIMMMKSEDFDAIIANNLRSAWLCCKAATRSMMRKRYGRVINITSVVGIAGNGGQTNYSASKAGMIGLTKSLAKEVASRNITVNAVAPGYIETDLTAKLSDELTQTALSHIPLNRLGKPEDIAAAVAFLASDDASYITGQVLVVDGGMII